MWSPREARVFKLLDIEGQAAKVELAPSVSQENMKILHVVRTVRPELVRSSSEFELVEISQYLPISQLLQSADLAKFDILLQGRNFLVGSTLSLADAVMYDAFVQQLSAGGGKNTASLLKKFTHLASYVSKLSSILKSDFQCSVPAADPSVSTDGAATATKKNKKEKPAAPAPEAAKSGDAASSDTGDALDPSKLDIRVGVVVKCWNHPESEKLLCEEIDLGEGSVRTIASGLRAHYAAEEVQGRQVLVLANLKERPMAGFLSQVCVIAHLSMWNKRNHPCNYFNAYV